MKNKFISVSILLMSLLLVACNNQADTEKAAQSEKVVIGLDDNFPPMGFRNDKGKIVGFDVDLARAATKRAGLSAEFKAIDWGAKEAELKSGRVDMLWNGLTITPARAEQVNFSKPYMRNHQIIIVDTGSTIKNKDDLIGKTIGLQDASSAISAVEADPIFTEFKEIKKYPDNVTALFELRNHRVDAVVVDEVLGRYYVAKHAGDYTVLKDDFGSEEYGIAFRKGDNTLLNKIEKSLAAMKADGSAKKISEKWFNANVME